MKRSRQLRRFLRACLLLVLGAVLAAVLLLPELGRRAARSALRRIDPHASFALREISPWSMTLANVALGEPTWLTARTVDVTFEPFEALSGRVRTVVVTGATWTQRAGAAPPPIGLPGGRALDLPLDRLEVRDSALVLDTGDSAMRVPLHVTLQRDAAQRFLVSAGSKGLSYQAPG